MRGYQEDFYNICGRMRDRANRLWKAEKVEYALTRLSKHPSSILAGLRCVDVGCSSGTVTNAVAPLFANIVGLEYDRVAVKNFEAPAAPHVCFMRGDAMSLPFANDAVDVVICSQVYEHVPDDTRLFSEIYRILRPGGVVFFSGPNRLFPYEFHYSLPFFHWLPGPLADLCLRILGRGDHFYEHLRTIWTLRRALSRFEIQDLTSDFLSRNPRVVVSEKWAGIVSHVPRFIWRLLTPFVPNFNWLLYKPVSEGQR